MNNKKVAVIEDEADIRDVLEYNLSREGFRVLAAGDGEQGLDAVRSQAPDVVLLDLMLPGLDGVELCRQLRMDATTRNIPVIMLTAKGEESDVVLGLGVGADDYVVKPFGTRELMARVRAVLRRGSLRESCPARLERSDISIDAERHTVHVQGQAVAFTATEFRLLHFLAAHPGRVFNRDTLLSRVIGEGAFVVDRNIDVHVRAIRKKLGAERDLIETIRGVGYRFADPA